MKVMADSFFCIGQAHVSAGKPCQDYALAHDDETPLAVVSDGCSTGGMTDVGARLIAHGWVQGFSDYSFIRLANGLGLQGDDLLATLGTIVVNDGVVTSQMFGDGVIAQKMSDSDLFMARYEWANNMPFYPAYKGNEALLGRFLQAHASIKGPSITEEAWHWDGCDFTPWDRVDALSVDDGISGLQRSYTPRESQTVAVFSDGITQLGSVDWKDAVVECMAHKNYNGSFVKRRMIRALKDAAKNGDHPVDDISCAAIRIEIDHE